ncbi:unnamed protein product [Pleuronectes platessa]|uniref:Uncharacterized protein n=1 Tax=Pleuronectes platessa TaxID=8262 RepID=A0A9N7Z0Z4_PLEPL|nr:unnamed protein product [Pleuronectes platessa]
MSQDYTAECAALINIQTIPSALLTTAHCQDKPVALKDRGRRPAAIKAGWMKAGEKRKGEGEGAQGNGRRLRRKSAGGKCRLSMLLARGGRRKGGGYVCSPVEPNHPGWSDCQESNSPQPLGYTSCN